MEIFPRFWPFIRGIHRSPVNSPHKGQWRGALMFYLICARTNDWVNNREAGALRRHCTHYDVTVIIPDVFAFAGAMASTQRTGIRVHICLQMSSPNSAMASTDIVLTEKWDTFSNEHNSQVWKLDYYPIAIACIEGGVLITYLISTTRKKLRR